MSDRIDADSLFGKHTPGNLNLKSLKKLRKHKKEYLNTIESNLPFLVDFWFAGGKEKANHEVDVFELVKDEELFLKPLVKLIKMAKKKKGEIEIPKGLHVILMETISFIWKGYNKEMGRFQNQAQAFGGKQTDQMKEEIHKLNETCTNWGNNLLAVAGMLVSKDVKWLMKLGFEEDAATQIARVFVPGKYLNEKNVRFYIHSFNNTLLDVQRDGVKKSEDDDESYTNSVGVNLADPEILEELYTHFFKGIDEREIFISGLLGMTLEFRPKGFNTLGVPVMKLYNEMNNLLLNILEGETVINYTDTKLSKKDKKELKVSKKELRKLMKRYLAAYKNEIKSGTQGYHRIIFTSLADDSFPRVMKAHKDAYSDISSVDMFEKQRRLIQQRQQQQQQNQNKQNQNNNNNNNPRNNNKGNNNKHR